MTKTLASGPCIWIFALRIWVMQSSDTTVALPTKVCEWIRDTCSKVQPRLMLLQFDLLLVRQQWQLQHLPVLQLTSYSLHSRAVNTRIWRMEPRSGPPESLPECRLLWPCQEQGQKTRWIQVMRIWQPRRWKSRKPKVTVSWCIYIVPWTPFTSDNF